MPFFILVADYWRWHYSQALGDLTRLTRNFAWFLYHFFSLPLLAKTLFAPWHRLAERRTRAFDFADWGGTLIVNLLMRVVGCLLRLCLIITGVVSLIIFTLTSVVIFLLWLLLPFGLLLLFAVGLKTIAL